MADKKELSEFYKIGYKSGFSTVLFLLKSIMPLEEYNNYSVKIKGLYDNYPNIEPLELKDL